MHHACDVLHYKNFLQWIIFIYLFNYLFYLQCLILKARIIKNWSVICPSLCDSDGPMCTHISENRTLENRKSLLRKMSYCGHPEYDVFPTDFMCVTLLTFFFLNNHASFTSVFATAGYFVM